MMIRSYFSGDASEQAGDVQKGSFQKGGVRGVIAIQVCFFM